MPSLRCVQLWCLVLGVVVAMISQLSFESVPTGFQNPIGIVLGTVFAVLNIEIYKFLCQGILGVGSAGPIVLALVLVKMPIIFAVIYLLGKVQLLPSALLGFLLLLPAALISGLTLRKESI